MDYYGRRLATCSSDHTVRVFKVPRPPPSRPLSPGIRLMRAREVDGEERELEQELLGHGGPVWRVAWAHPSFGDILASCSFDGKVCLWEKRDRAGQFELLREHNEHRGFSVNDLAFGPHTCGKLILACASSDGNISVLVRTAGALRGRPLPRRRRRADSPTPPDGWSNERIQGAHRFIEDRGAAALGAGERGTQATGATSLSWSPFPVRFSLVPGGPDSGEELQLVSGGCDHKCGAGPPPRAATRGG